MLSTINISLQKYMKYPFFKKAYHKFISYFLAKVKSFNANQFKNPDITARKFIQKFWNKFFDKEKKAFDYDKNKKRVKKLNKKNRKVHNANK